MKYWSPAIAALLSSESGRRMELVKPEFCIETFSYPSDLGSWKRKPLLFPQTQWMTTSLMTKWSPSRRTQKILQKMSKTPRMIQMRMMYQVCLQDHGLEAKVHHQHWLAPDPFPNVVITHNPPCCPSKIFCLKGIQVGL